MSCNECISSILWFCAMLCSHPFSIALLFFLLFKENTPNVLSLARALKNRLRKTLENKLCCAIRCASYSLCEYWVLRKHVNERLEAILNKKKIRIASILIESRTNLHYRLSTSTKNRQCDWQKYRSDLDKCQHFSTNSIQFRYSSNASFFSYLSMSAHVLRVWRDEFTLIRCYFYFVSIDLHEKFECFINFFELNFCLLYCYWKL